MSMIYAFISIVVAYLAFSFALGIGVNLFGNFPAGMATGGLFGALCGMMLYDYLTEKW